MPTRDEFYRLFDSSDGEEALLARLENFVARCDANNRLDNTSLTEIRDYLAQSFEDRELNAKQNMHYSSEPLVWSKTENEKALRRLRLTGGAGMVLTLYAFAMLGFTVRGGGVLGPVMDFVCGGIGLTVMEITKKYRGERDNKRVVTRVINKDKQRTREKALIEIGLLDQRRKIINAIDEKMKATPHTDLKWIYDHTRRHPRLDLG
jgi:hypothetical protein